MLAFKCLDSPLFQLDCLQKSLPGRQDPRLDLPQKFRWSHDSFACNRRHSVLILVRRLPQAEREKEITMVFELRHFVA